MGYTQADWENALQAAPGHGFWVHGFAGGAMTAPLKEESARQLNVGSVGGLVLMTAGSVGVFGMPASSLVVFPRASLEHLIEMAQRAINDIDEGNTRLGDLADPFGNTDPPSQS